MLQEAIIATSENASTIADTLVDYSAEDIIDETLIFRAFGKPAILVRQRVGSVYVVSHIITEAMFYANAMPTSPLNDKNFVEVTQL